MREGDGKHRRQVGPSFNLSPFPKLEFAVRIRVAAASRPDLCAQAPPLGGVLCFPGAGCATSSAKVLLHCATNHSLVGSLARSWVTYEQVASAADGLLVRGEAATLRAIRAQLKGGSMGTLQKHLARWKAGRQRTQATTPFAVDATDVGNLNPRDFVMLINHLVRNEARLATISSSPDTTVQINSADDGVDGAIRWSNGPPRTRHLPSRNVVWQAKSGKLLSPSELVRELQLRDKSGLKRLITDHFRVGGSYVLFAAADMTPLQKTVRLEAMTATIRQHLPERTPVVSIVSGAELAAWASEDLWARTVLIRASGREHPATLMTLDDWANTTTLANPYVWCPATSSIAERLRETVQTPGKVYRIDGAPGLGKTRLALEALRTPTQRSDSIVYFNASFPGADAELLKALANWARAGVSGTLVVDNCSLMLHQEIVRQLSRLPMSAVTIGDRQESNADATLYPLDDQTIDKIVDQHPLRPQQHAAVSRIIEYAEGWPIMALAVLQALRDGLQHIAELRDDALTRRLLGEPETDGLRVLRLLSLFDHVGYRDSASDQWETLRETFVPDIARDQFFAIARHFEKKGIITQIGRYWRVTPSPLAVRLAREWLDQALPEMQERLFSQLDGPLLQSLAQRFSEITTASSKDLAHRLFAANARFGDIRSIVARENARIFRALAEVDPEGAAGVITRTLVSLSDADSKAINESGAHQDLVSALERLAFHAAYFKSAATGLYILARTESTRYSNNARGTLEKLFRVQGAQTEASTMARLDFLDEISGGSDETSDRLVAGCLKAILELNPAFVRQGVESQGGRRPLDEWRPHLWSEIFDYYRGALARSVALAKHSDSSRILAMDIIAESIPTLARYQLWDELESAIDSIGPKGAWSKAVERIKWSIRHSDGNQQALAASRPQEILAKLMPTNLHDRVRLLITEAHHELVLRDGHYSDVSVEHVRGFAEESISQGTTASVFQLLSTGRHRLSHAYGQFVAEQTTNIATLLDEAITSYENAPNPRCDLPLLGISVGLVNRGLENRRDDLLARLACTASLIDALPAVAAIPFATEQSATLLIEYAKLTSTKPPRPNLFIGQCFGRLADATVCDVAIAFSNRGWYAAAFESLLFLGRTSEAIDNTLADIILTSDFITEGNLLDIHEWSVFETIRKLVRSGHERFALSIAERIMSMSSTASYAQRGRVADLWPDLLVHDTVFAELRKKYSALDRRERWHLLIGTKYVPEGQVEQVLALEALPLDLLMAFAGEFPDDVPWFLAENGALSEMVDGEFRFTALMIALLEHFGERADVLGGIEANLHSFLSVGPREPYFNQRAGLIKSLPTFNRVNLASWKENLRLSFEGEQQRAQLADAEFERGIF
jgi:hypothetical protein